jgi:hypothetical protein
MATTPNVERVRVLLMAARVLVSPAHVHVTGSSSSCDGPYSSWHVWRPRRFALARELFDVATTRSVDLGYAGEAYRVPVYVRVDGRTVTSGHDTEEGYTHTSLDICRDDCDDVSGQRDVYAERMGY